MTNIIGIRAEDKNPWERRSPLIPSHVGVLIRAKGVLIPVLPEIYEPSLDELREPGLVFKKERRPIEP